MAKQSKKTGFTKKELLRLGKVRTFTGANLAEVAFPLGGIGTGCVSLGGRGNLRDWEIFNRPGKGRNLPFTFVAIRTEQRGKKLLKLVEREILPPYIGGHGFAGASMPGFPRLREARFTGEFPFARIEFSDADLPVKVELEAFSPFVPLAPEDSGLPVAVLTYRLTNISRQPVEASLLACLLNAVGYDGVARLSGTQWEGFGSNVNEIVRDGVMTALKLTSTKYGRDDVRSGSIALATPAPDVSFTPTIFGEGKWENILFFWNDFEEKGTLPNDLTAPATPDQHTNVGALAINFDLDPGATSSVPLVLAWHFPLRENIWNPEAKGRLLKNHYATVHADAEAVARHTISKLQRLETDTRLFHDALFSTSVPPYVLDAASSQLSTIHTNTCLWLDDGHFYGFEGCGESCGCCWMNCTHVWNYEQAVAHLFPSLERTMRKVDFLHNTNDEGHMAFRTILPLDLDAWKWKPAADGQMGCIMKLYREWQLSGDAEFLRSVWPKAKKALEFAWKDWDPRREGVFVGEQHNTYDIEFFGPNPMTAVLYLGALRAGEEMAHALGEPDKAAEYRQVFERGVKRIESELWNGEYYYQVYDDSNVQRHQYGRGCLTDQLLGQWFAMVAGLGPLLDPKRVRKALTSIFKYNWRSDLRNHAHIQRVYALGDERGLLICSWPKGGRPKYPCLYVDEVWTGIEYQAAAHMIYEGLLEQGLSIVKGVRDRHDGIRRNPWNEPECGDHYARAMSSWSLILALSGYNYSAPKGRLRFAPRLAVPRFRTFFSTGSAWGIWTQKAAKGKLTAKLEVLYGTLDLQSLSIGGVKVPKKAKPTAQIGKMKIEAAVHIAEEGANLDFAQPISLFPGGPLTISL